MLKSSLAAPISYSGSTEQEGRNMDIRMVGVRKMQCERFKQKGICGRNRGMRTAVSGADRGTACSFCTDMHLA